MRFLKKVERTVSERLSTPRPAQKVVLKSAWQSQQQQQDTLECASSRTKQLLRRVEGEQREIKVTRLNGQSHPAPGNWSGEMSQLLKKSLNLKSTSVLKELHKL